MYIAVMTAAVLASAAAAGALMTHILTEPAGAAGRPARAYSPMQVMHAGTGARMREDAFHRTCLDWENGETERYMEMETADRDEGWKDLFDCD